MPHYRRTFPRPALGRLTYKGQLTIPREIRSAVGLDDGDLVEISVGPGGRVVITPKLLIDKKQAWFWSKEWQAKERQADAELRRGRLRSFKNLKELLKDLRSQ